MIRRLLTTLGIPSISHETYYCAPCGGYYPFQHFCE